MTIIIQLIVLAFAFIQAEKLVLRNDPQVSTTTEFSDYSSNTQKYSLVNSELEALVKFEIINDEGPTTSWKNIDEKYGRVRAF